MVCWEGGTRYDACWVRRKTLMGEVAECDDVGEREKEREREMLIFFSVLLSFSRGRR